jgi:hypothetical protein
MTLSDLASLGSFVSGVAVLISLVYLALQVRQAEKNQRAVINDGYASRLTDLLRWTAEPANSALMARVTAGETSFTAEEVNRLGAIFRMVLINTQATFQQYESGLLDKRSYETSMIVLKDGYLGRPVYRALWPRWAQLSSPDFRSAVEALLRDAPLRPPVDTFAAFQRHLARELTSVPTNPEAASSPQPVENHLERSRA